MEPKRMPGRTARPASAARPVRSARPVRQARPARPVRSAQPVRPAQTAGPVRSAQKKQSAFSNLFHTGGMDIPFLCLVFILFAVGITMMYSASYVYAQNKYGNPNYFFFRQLIWGALGFAAMWVISKIDYRILNSVLAPIACILTVLLLIATFLLNLHEEVRRWIKIGPLQFQPSEIAKFVMVLTLAYLICIFYRVMPADPRRRTVPRVVGLTRMEQSFLSYFDNDFKCTVLLALVVAMFCGLIIIEKHLSCTILMFLMGVSMMWVGGVKKKWFLFLAVAAAAAFILVYLKPDLLEGVGFGYDRVMVWKTKEATANADYWQTRQGLLAIGSGGPFGVGFGNSKQKYLYIPEPQNDFIFAVVVEELGYIGGTLIILLFAALVCRGFMIATRTRDLFGALLVIGIVMQVGLQVILNIAVVTDTIPNTGIGLPFFSYGGTALFFMLCQMGVVLSVSRRVPVRVPKPAGEEEAV